MLKRVLLILALFALLILSLQGCNQGPEAYFDMRMEAAGGRPYLLLQHCSSSPVADLSCMFSIYTPAGKDLNEWEPVLTDRLGPASGFFMQQAAPESATASTPEELGTFHKGRATLFNPASKPPAASFAMLPFKWEAETAVQFKGATYAFGVESPPDAETRPNELSEGTLRAAKYNGQAWEELKAAGPKVSSYPNGGFSLDAVACEGGIKIFWRLFVLDQIFPPFLEGLREVTIGDLSMAGFDGQAFGGNVTKITGLPRGNLDFWAGPNGSIKTLAQVHDRSGLSSFPDGAMAIFEVVPEAETASQAAHLIETISGSEAPSASSLFGFISAKHISWLGREFILRSNWQSFEVWNKTDEQVWKPASRSPNGLPVYNVETVLASAGMLSLGLLAFGIGLAYQRRKAAWKPGRKIRAREIYGSISARIAAYAIDLTIILTATILFSQKFGWGYLPMQNLMDYDFLQVPQPFFIFYMGYLSISEWLWGATLGKYIMGLRVIVYPGQKMTFWAAVVRNLAGFYERLPLPALFVPLPMFIFTPRRQRLGDLLAHTYVVHKATWDAFNLQRAEEMAAAGEEGKRFAWEDEDPWQGAGKDK